MNTNLHHFLWFDPGGTMGWAYCRIRREAFVYRDERVLSNVEQWRSGELTGTERQVIQKGVDMVRKLVYSTSFLLVDIGTEDFDLVQTRGGKENVLSPVRINAVLDWEVGNCGAKLHYQNRALRTSQTRERIKAFGIPSPKGKDALAAMQHLVYRVRTVKKASMAKPWKMNLKDVVNGG